jgi:transcriptional regulator with XRE-family HTH domain
MAHFHTPCRSAYPLVRDLMARIETSPLTLGEICKRAGLTYYTLLRWRQGIATPNLNSIADLLTVLGAEVRIVEKE